MHRKKVHQEDAPWLVEEAKSVDAVEEGSSRDITEEELRKTIRKLKNWKARGQMEYIIIGINISPPFIYISVQH
eukprot:7799251-Ditylum_brightwellii.AAC.1